MTNAPPDLQIPMLKYGRGATPWDLKPFLYKGGAAIDRRLSSKAQFLEEVAIFLPCRLDLVVALHDEITASLVAGEGHSSATRRLINLRVFFNWIDANCRSGSLETIEQDFIDWTKELLQFHRTQQQVQSISLYGQVSTVSKLLEEVLGLPRASILHKSRVRKPPHYYANRSAKSETEEVSDTFRFGHFLMDLCDGLGTDAIRGMLPLQIRLREGSELEEWCGLVNPSKVKALQSTDAPGYKLAMKNRIKWSEDTSLERRRPLINLRIQAELLIFISQTSMNLAQAYKLKSGSFAYRSHYDGYQVQRVYKDRRKGEVEFEIFAAYKKPFERYLAWRSQFFPDDASGRLFPLESHHERSEDIAPAFSAIEVRCSQLGIRYIGPRTLRKTRLNWYLRRTNDIEMTAQAGQHSPDTLLQYYIRPNHQLAMLEVSRFHAANDPALASPGPGVCVLKQPEILKNSPEQAPEPDCMNSAGCLFCCHHRDVESFDYVWSLASYRHLKTLELAQSSSVKKPKLSAVAAVVERTTAKLKCFAQSQDHLMWVDEAEARIQEENFHPQWDGFIQLFVGGWA